MMKKKLAYYAHSMALYDTPQEARDLTLLREIGYDVLNFNDKPHQAELAMWRDGGKEAMAYFERLVYECDVLFFRALIDGSIPSGVGQEILWAQRRSMPILELPSMIDRRVLSYDETVCVLKELGQR